MRPITFSILIFTVALAVDTQANSRRHHTSMLPILSLNEYVMDSSNETMDFELGNDGKTLKLKGYLPNGCYQLPIYKNINRQGNVIKIEFWSRVNIDSYCKENIRYFTEELILDRLQENTKIKLIINSNSKHKKIIIINQ